VSVMYFQLTFIETQRPFTHTRSVRVCLFKAICALKLVNPNHVSALGLDACKEKDI